MKTLKTAKGNIKTLLGVTDYKSVKAIQKENPNQSRKEIEAWLLDNYNSIVETINNNEKELKAKEKKMEKQLKKDNKTYIQEFTISFELKQKGKTKWRKVTTSHSIVGKKSQLKKLLEDYYNERVAHYEEISPTNFRKPSYKAGSAIEVKTGNGLANINMKNAGSFGLSNEKEQEWDTQTGKCVFDYLIHLYGNVKGFKKIMNYEYLNNEFTFANEEDALTAGVSINKIHDFCVKYKLSYYALDCYENTIKFYVPPEKKHNVASLIFRIINEHMYPIEDFALRKSIVSKNRGDVNIKSVDVDTTQSKKEKPLYQVISPDQDCDKNEFAIDFIEKLNKIPYPIKASNIYYEDGNIKRLVIDDKLILTEPINESVKNFYENGEKKYQGQCIQNILFELWEDTYGENIYQGELMSSFNPDVKELLSQKNIKYRTHFGATREITEDMKELFLNEGAVSCDIEKCYSSLLLNPLDEFIKLETYNDIQEFINDDYYYNQDELPIGLYVVETNDMTILHKSNVYSNKILDYAKQNGIDFNIKYKIITTTTIDKTYFHSILDNIKERTTDANLIKLVMNTITGCLGKTYGKFLKVGLTTNLDEIFENEIIKHIDDKVNDFYFKKFNILDKDLFLFGEIEKTKFVSNSLPIYIQLLDWSNIKLHQMIKEMGGECVYRKTDCAVCIGGNQVNEIEKDKTNITKTWGSFRNEDCSSDDIIERNYTRLMNTDRHIDIPNITDDWNIKNFNSSSQWKEILDYAIENKGLFVDGRAGTGKSFIIHKGIENKILNEDSKYRLAFTNKAARNINGTTIHKSLAINKKDKSNIKSMTLKYQGKTIICIDEIGMIALNVWKKILLLKEANKELIFILLGDKRQCKPIEDLSVDYFNSTIIKSLVNYNKCELTERQRYDEELWNFLEDYYVKGITGKLKHKKPTKEDMKNSKMICYYNKTRDAINDMCMNTLKPNNCLYLPYERKKDEDGNIIDKGDKANSAYIYKDLPVMCVKNNKKFKIINTDEFKVKEYNDANIILTNIDTNEDLTIEYKDFHLNFVVNYISTTHKLQGSTITQKLFIYDWYCPYECGLYGLKQDRNVGYTALSRVKTLDQIYIVN